MEDRDKSDYVIYRNSRKRLHRRLGAQLFRTVKELGFDPIIIKTFPLVVTHLNKPGNWVD